MNVKLRCQAGSCAFARFLRLLILGTLFASPLVSHAGDQSAVEAKVDRGVVEPGDLLEQDGQEALLVHVALSGMVPKFSGTADMLQSGSPWMPSDALIEGQWQTMLEDWRRRARGGEGSASFSAGLWDAVSRPDSFLDGVADRLAERKKQALLRYAQYVQAREWQEWPEERPWARGGQVEASNPPAVLSAIVASLTVRGDGSAPPDTARAVLRLDGFLAPINVDPGTSDGSLVVNGNGLGVNTAGDGTASAPPASWYGLPPEVAPASGANAASNSGSLLSLAPPVSSLPPILNPAPSVAVPLNTGSGGAIPQSVSPSVTTASVTTTSATAVSPPGAIGVGGNTATVTLHEDGTGNLQTNFTPPGGVTLPSSLAADPGPGGQPSALTFNLLGPPGLVAGDVLLLDPSSALSDVIRFNSSNGTVVFYSLPGGGLLADTGFPTAFYSNNLPLAEAVSGPTFYTPNPGQPGAISGFTTTYVFDLSAIPEPAAWSIMGTGILALVGLPRLRRRRQALAV